MRQPRTESWRFAHGIDQSLHALLYARHALDLDVDRSTAEVKPARIVVRRQGMNPEMRLVPAAEKAKAWMGVVASPAIALVVLLVASLLLVACGPERADPVTRPEEASRAELCRSVPRLDRLVVTRSDDYPQNHMHFSFPATITVADAAQVREAARALCALPKMPSGTFSCPADFAIVYHLAFSAAGERFPAVSVDATGCEVVRGLTTTRWVARTPGFWHTLGEAMGLVDPSYATFHGIGPSG